MNNPHLKDNWYLHYLDEANIHDQTKWHDIGMWVEAGGLALFICTININTSVHANVGFRLVDEKNKPLTPFRTSTNTRIPAHFTGEPHVVGAEDHLPVTFHMIVNCKYVKLQFRTGDGNFRINMGPPGKDRPWNHKTISTMTAIPLLPHYQGGANTVFTYPQSSMSQMPDDKDKGKPRSGYTKSLGPSDS